MDKNFKYKYDDLFNPTLEALKTVLIIDEAL